MQRSRSAAWKSAGILLAAAVIVAMGGASLRAQTNGTWIQTVDGDWGVGTNWQSGNIADGVNATADFTQVDLVDQGAGNLYTVSADLEAAHTIGHLTFDDANPSSPGAFQIYSSTAGTALTLSGTNPSITVDTLGPIDAAAGFNRDAATIGPSAILAGTQGFTKLGAGVLHLSGANTITGAININAGTLRFTTAATNAALPATAVVNIGNGATLESSINLNAVGTRIFTVASGATATISVINDTDLGRFDAAGANINVVFPTSSAAGSVFTPSGNWLTTAATANPATFTVTGQGPAPVTAGVFTGGAVNLAPNNAGGGSQSIRNFNANTFATTPVVLNNAAIIGRTNSGGNVFNFGSLSGDATAILSGGVAGGMATYSIGALNTPTTFAGTIDSATAYLVETSAATTGGINITKVGTSTLTLTGAVNPTPSTNANASLRGGIVTVSAGTLKMSGNGAIGGGDATTPTTVRILSGAIFDVSTTNTTYSSAPFQQTIGVGTILGNYNHDEGFLAPGDTLNGTNPVPIAALGTLPITGNLNFGGSGGTIRYDVTGNTASADLINVTGVTNLSGTPTLDIGFLGGFTTGLYTILTSSGGFGGTNPSGWIVDWPARGTAPTLQVSGNNLQLNVSQPPTGAVTWSGAASGDWIPGAAGPVNWFNTVTNVADRYFDLDAVTFADTANGNPVTTSTVALNTVVTPLSTTVNNSTAAYTIAGSGKITGSTTFTKQGSALLTMTTVNDFTGAASIQGGEVNIGNANTALGTGPLTMSGGSKLTVVSTTNGSTLTNSSLTMAAGSANTVEVNGTTAISFVLPNLAGDGDITLNTTVAGKIITLGSDNRNFTGDVSIAANGTSVLVRTNGNNASFPNSHVNLGTAGQLRDFNNGANNALNLQLGSLTGAVGSVLGGNTGGSGAVPKNWVIGGLNTSTTFAGNVEQGTGNNSTIAPTHITKVGTGTLTLTGANTSIGSATVAAGNTTVLQGILSISNTTSTYFPDLGDVFVSTGGILDLSFPGVDTIDSLFLNGGAKVTGTWGAPGSGATNTSSLFTGTGQLMVTTLGVTPGDFDGDGDVDSADLTTGANSFNSRFGNNAANNLTGFDFLAWQRTFGGTPTSPTAAAVPEPAGLALLLVGLAVLPAARRRGRN